MKKSLIFLSFCLIFATIVLNFPNYQNSNIAYAQESAKYISIIGRAEIEKQADYVEFSFCIQNTSNSHTDAQSKINQTLDNLKTKLSEVDNSCEVIISNSYTKPTHKNTNSYTTMCNFIVKSTCFECVDKIIEVAGNNGITCFNGVNYVLENREDIFDEVYELAKQDADNKALNISKSAKMIDSYNFRQINMPFTNNSKNIKISAKVKNLYEIPSNTNNIEPNNDIESNIENNDNNLVNNETDNIQINDNNSQLPTTNNDNDTNLNINENHDNLLNESLEDNNTDEQKKEDVK